MRFRATIELNGRTATGIHVPDEVVEALGAGKRPAVQVTIGAHTYASTIASRGGRFLLPVSGENRELAGVAAGDVVDVDLVVDALPRELEIPGDFAQALAADAQAKTFFDGLSFSQRRWFVDGIEQAVKPETRQRRIDAAVSRLREGRGQR
jgi:Bacteriocin-protection, YdeI or OmpD-Associated/Domain of unknown function (DUF1905)